MISDMSERGIASLSSFAQPPQITPGGFVCFAAANAVLKARFSGGTPCHGLGQIH